VALAGFQEPFHLLGGPKEDRDSSDRSRQGGLPCSGIALGGAGSIAVNQLHPGEGKLVTNWSWDHPLCSVGQTYRQR